MTGHRVLIVGASRGLGQGLANEFFDRGAFVVATTRSEPRIGEKAKHGVKEFRLELNDPQDGDRLSKAYDNGSFDAIIMNAGMYGPKHQRADELTKGEVEALFLTNAISPVRLARQLLALVRRDGIVAFMSSRTASITLNEDGDMELYRSSKAALNSLVRSFALRDALPRRIGVLLMHPGWVQTEMGGAAAPITVAESIVGLHAVILGALDRPEFSFKDYRGETLPW